MLRKSLLIIFSIFVARVFISCDPECDPVALWNYDVTFTGTYLDFIETNDTTGKLLYVSMKTEEELVTFKRFDFLNSMKFQTLTACATPEANYNFEVEIVSLKVFSKLSNGEYLDVSDEFVVVDNNGDYLDEIEDSLVPYPNFSSLSLKLDYRSEEKEIKEGDTFKVRVTLEDGNEFEHENTL